MGDHQEVCAKITFGIGLGADTGPEQLSGIVDHLEATGVDSLWFSEPAAGRSCTANSMTISRPG
jgi:hypothetical protein